MCGEKHPVSGLAVLFYGKLMRRVSQFLTVKLLCSSSLVEVFHFRDSEFSKPIFPIYFLTVLVVYCPLKKHKLRLPRDVMASRIVLWMSSYSALTLHSTLRTCCSVKNCSDPLSFILNSSFDSKVSEDNMNIWCIGLNYKKCTEESYSHCIRVTKLLSVWNLQTSDPPVWVHGSFLGMLAHSGTIPVTGEADVRIALPTLAGSQWQWVFDGDRMRAW